MTQSMLKILVCEDDKYFRMAIKDLLKTHALITEVDSASGAMELLNTEYFDIALIDMNLEAPNLGLSVLKVAKQKGLHSIILSSENDESIIEKAYENKCDHFLAKLHYRKHLEPYIIQFKNRLEDKDLSKFFEEKFLTCDEKLIKSITEVAGISLKEKTILITGETGVGKSLIGELLHQQTYDKNKPFVHLNCSEIAENLVESELFGHEKGAFTGATEAKDGKLAMADGGTLFLDEIATMPMNMQKKLLKALDSKTFYRVGGDKPIKSEFTMISATCEDLFEKIHLGEFRKDLFFRISGFNLEIPPLRKRKHDIPLLIKAFAAQSPRKIVVKDDAVKKCADYSWPGNIRELKKKVEILSSMNKGIIRSQDIIFGNRTSEGAQDYLTEAQKEFIQLNGLRDFIAKIEQECIKQSLEHNSGKITHAIKELRISASAFYRILNQTNPS